MKKIIVFLMCLCFVGVSARAYDECVGGTEITAKNGTKFCKSNLGMNWWSAFNWCASNGGTLARFSKMCPGVQTVVDTGAGACPNLQQVLNGEQWVWSDLGYGSNSALHVDLFSGAVVNLSPNHATYIRALCE